MDLNNNPRTQAIARIKELERTISEGVSRDEYSAIRKDIDDLQKFLRSFSGSMLKRRNNEDIYKYFIADNNENRE